MSAELARLEAALGYRFTDRELLEHALTHRSRVHEEPTGRPADNESLEFLGDAVLGFAVADLVYRACPDRDEGGKSKIKARLVSAATLAERARTLGLGAHLRLGKGEERSGGRAKTGLLSDTYEAVLAAVYLDGGIEPARALIARQFEPLLEAALAETRGGGLGTDAKSALQEWAQAHGRPAPTYDTLGERGPDHAKVFEVGVMLGAELMATAEGRRKKEAEQRAAAAALGRLRERG